MKNICPNCNFDMDYHNMQDEKKCQAELSKKLFKMNSDKLYSLLLKKQFEGNIL